MKIAYIRSSFPKHSETFILEEILYLVRAGHDVRIVARWCDLSHLNVKILDNGLLERVLYEDMKNLTWSARWQLIWTFLRQFLRSQRYRLFFFYDFFEGRDVSAELAALMSTALAQRGLLRSWFTRRFHMFNIWFMAMRINNLSLAKQQYTLRFKEFVPDLIHCPFLFRWDSIKLRELSRQFPSTPVTVTLRSRDIFLNSQDDQYVALRDAIIHDCQQVFVISEYNRRELARRYQLRRPMEVVHSSIDAELFSVTTDVPKKRNKIICVARLVPKKGLDLLIDACAILAREGLSFHLSIVGGGPLKQDLAARIAALGLQTRVALLGPCRQGIIKKMLAEAEVFVLPCVVAADGDRDMLPNSLKEAMAMKLAVVTTNISGIEELITDQVHGLLSAPDDTVDLAAKIKVALTNKMLAKQLGEQARGRIEADFSILGEGRKFVAALEALTR